MDSADDDSGIPSMESPEAQAVPRRRHEVDLPVEPVDYHSQIQEPSNEIYYGPTIVTPLYLTTSGVSWAAHRIFSEQVISANLRYYDATELVELHWEQLLNLTSHLAKKRQ